MKTTANVLHTVVILEDLILVVNSNNMQQTLQGKCNQVPGRNDYNEFKKLESQLQLVGFSADQQQTIWKTLAAILHLGNVYFRPNDVSCY